MAEELERIHKISNNSQFMDSDFALDTIFQHVQNT